MDVKRTQVVNINFVTCTKQGGQGMQWKAEARAFYRVDHKLYPRRTNYVTFCCDYNPISRPRDDRFMWMRKDCFVGEKGARLWAVSTSSRSDWKLSEWKFHWKRRQVYRRGPTKTAYPMSPIYTYRVLECGHIENMWYMWPNNVSNYNQLL